MTEESSHPQADRTQLQQIIAALPQGVIIIEPDQTIAWANEAALAMHGVDALDELGETISEYRSRFELRYRNQHKLPAGAYPMDRLVAGEAFSEVVVEVVGAADGKHRVQQIRSLVITDAAGQPDCLVLVLEDETERFDAEERFESAFGANPAPAIIARLSDLRYVKVNQGFLDMTGFKRDSVIGRSLHEIDVLEGAEQRALAIERLHEGRTIPQMEACLRTAELTAKTVIVAGQPIEIAEAACMLFTFADLDPRKRAEAALVQSEARFAAVFKLAPSPMAVIALDGLRIMDVNEALTAATGWRRDEVVGRSAAELGLWGTGEMSEQLADLVRESGHLRSVDVQVNGKDGRTCDYLLSAETVVISAARCVLTVMQDITARKQSEAELLTAIESVMQDTSWFGQKIVEQLANLTRQGSPAKPDLKVAELTPRGRAVLELIAQGLSDVAVADRLEMSRNTVRNHVSAIYKLIGIHRRSDLVLWARERGLGRVLQAAGKPRAKRSQSTTPSGM